MQKEVLNFIEWRYHVQDLYSNIVFYVLPTHPLSLHFTQNSAVNEDSIIHGIVMGFSETESTKSNISLFNIPIPNKTNFQFQSNPKYDWGSFIPMSEIPFDNSLTSFDMLPDDSILAATSSDITFITSENKSSIFYEESPILMIKSCHVSKSETTDLSSFLFHENGSISYLNEQGIISNFQNFSRPTLDASVDPFSPNNIITTQGKKTLRILDLRQKEPILFSSQHQISSLSYSPFSPFIFACGCFQGSILLHDIRMPEPLSSIQAHEKMVTQIKWSPLQKDALAACSLDNAVTIWSIQESDAKSPKSPNVFVHSGHVTPIISIDWCKNSPWTIASLSEDNLFEMWTVSSSQLEI